MRDLNRNLIAGTLYRQAQLALEGGNVLPVIHYRPPLRSGVLAFVP